MARYERMRRGGESVFYLTGTDEHGEKLERAAQAKGALAREERAREERAREERARPGRAARVGVGRN